MSARHCSEQGVEKLPEIEDFAKRHPRAATRENVDFSKKERSRDWAAAYSSKGAEEKSDLGHQETCAQKGGKSPFKQDTAKKGKDKGIRSRDTVQRDNSAERKCSCKAARGPSRKEDRVQCFNYKDGSCDEIISTPPNCKYFKNDM